MQLTSTLAVISLPLLAHAATHPVSVGQNGLTFTPNIVTAAIGDKVTFSFFPKNHSVVASSFKKPCVPIQPDGGIFSGFMPTAAQSPYVFEVTVNDTKPIWIYCAQAKHCETGMSMVINEPSGPNSLEAYQAAAKDVAASAAPPSVAGGIFLAGAANSTAANGTYTSSATPGASTGAKSGAGFTGAAYMVTPAAGVALLGLAGLFAGFLVL